MASTSFRVTIKNLRGQDLPAKSGTSVADPFLKARGYAWVRVAVHHWRDELPAAEQAGRRTEPDAHAHPSFDFPLPPHSVGQLRQLQHVRDRGAAPHHLAGMEGDNHVCVHNPLRGRSGAQDANARGDGPQPLFSQHQHRIVSDDRSPGEGLSWVGW
jgi:hypothetical protein